jgi:putative transposase
VWCPKYRRKVLVNTVDERLKTILLQVAQGLQSTIIEMEIMPDHVHLLVEVDPQLGIHRLVKRLKGVSARMLRAEFATLRSRLPSLWTNSYFVATVGCMSLDTVRQYIENQKHV